MSFRSQYDTDVTTFGPDGRLLQVEYAMAAVQQGSAVVGICSKEICVLASIRRRLSELSSYQRKLFKIDDHVGMGIAGLIADARGLNRMMRTECLNYKYVRDTAMPVQRLVTMVADKSQVYTQTSQKRPYGVGLLVIGYDKAGPHLYETSPSGQYFEYIAQAFGARSQAAKTYIEKNVAEFEDCKRDELIKHAIHAVKTTLATNDLTPQNVQVAIVGKDTPFTILDETELERYVDEVNEETADDGDASAAMTDE